MLAFLKILSSLRRNVDGETEGEREKSMHLKGELSTSFYKVYHMPIYKGKETVNLMKYNSQLISVEHRRSIPHQK